jgi:DNA-binding NtrC family response regulator
VATQAQKLDRVVLMVEDDPGILELYSKGLEQQGFRVVKAGTAAVALQRARQLGRIDILVSDVVLLDQANEAAMHGIELMRRIMALQPDVKVILFSGQSQDNLQALGGVPAGAIFLEKPFTLQTLVKTITRALAS